MKKSGFLIPLITSAYLLVCVLGYLGIVTSHTNLLGWFLILTAVAYGISGPFLIRTNLRRDKPIVRKEYQDRSFWGVLPGFLLVFYGAPLEWLWFPSLLLIALGIWSQIIGLVLIALGLALLGWALISLRGLYSGRVQVLASHSLVQSGPYRIVRHPAYAGYILMCLGIGIGYSSLLGLISLVILLVPGLVYRIRIEEKILALEFGDQYSAYILRTKRLIPHIW